MGCVTVIPVFQVTVILKHVFAPAELEQEPTMKTDLEADMASECAKLGPVDKVSLPCQFNTCMSYAWQCSLCTNVISAITALCLLQQ